jgi:two-component system cell cycle sensor histidine kinase/response regulator CckA
MFRSSHNVWLTVAMVVVIGIGTYSYLDSQAFREAARSAEQSRALVERAHELLSLLKDAESGQRGYLLTGEAAHLVDYNQALLRIRGTLAALGADAGGGDRRRLYELVGIELDEMAQSIRIRDQGDSSAALASVQTGRGKQIMDQVHDLVARNIAQEEIRYRGYDAAAQRHGYQTRILIQVGSLLFFGLLWFATRRINRLLEAQNRLIADLEMTREREARGSAALATTLRSIGDAVIATDTEGRIHFMNAVAEILTGWTNAAAAGRPLGEVLHIEDEITGQPAPDLALQVAGGGVMGLASHAILVGRDGSRVPVDDSAAPIHDEQGNITGVVLVFRDVTLRRQAQRRLEESESRYRLLFDANPQPMWVFDAGSLAFLAVNQAAITRYGYTREEFLGMTLRDIRPPEDIPALLEHTRISARTPHKDGPWRHRTKDGTILIVEIAAHPIQFGEAAAVLAMPMDITERKRLEEELRQSQKLEAVGQLAGGVAHDFNNLLTVIEGYAEMLRADLAPDDARCDPVDEILLASQRAASLTRQLLAFSRRQILQPIRLNLNANVASTQRMLSRLLGENIRIETVLTPQLWDVFADPGQVDQIIMNLAVNARDAMDHGGKLKIETANVERGTGPRATPEMADRDWVRLSVTDTGRGMDEETQRRIFEPFFTTKEAGRGTGMGLSTVYGIVKQSDGHIQVWSGPATGSSFSIYLPRAEQAGQAIVKVAAGAAPAQHTGQTILVVEDEETVRHLVVSMLKSSGYQVIAPATPHEALRICEEFSAPVDLLLTDVVLPDTDGIEVAQKAVASRPNLRILLMSGYTEHALLRLPGYGRGAPFIQKPFTKATLTAKVREVLR